MLAACSSIYVETAALLTLERVSASGYCNALLSPQLLQPLACIEHPRLDCAAVGSDDVCDLVYRFLMGVNEVDNFSMRGRQLYKAVEKDCAVLVVLGCCLG